MRNLRTQKENGYITLMVVVIVGAFTAAVVLSALQSGVAGSNIGMSFMESYKARSYANACAEKALYRIHNNDISLSGSESSGLTFDDGSTCTYTATVSGGGGVTINAVGLYQLSRVPVAVAGTVSSGHVTITSWQ